MRGLNELVYKKCLENTWHKVSPQEMLAVVIISIIIIITIIIRYNIRYCYY